LAGLGIAFSPCRAAIASTAALACAWQAAIDGCSVMVGGNIGSPRLEEGEDEQCLGGHGAGSGWDAGGRRCGD
jgi:hypothetical protein